MNKLAIELKLELGSFAPNLSQFFGVLFGSFMPKENKLQLVLKNYSLFHFKADCFL